MVTPLKKPFPLYHIITTSSQKHSPPITNERRKQGAGAAGRSNLIPPGLGTVCPPGPVERRHPAGCVGKNVKPQADANVDAQEDETETEDDEILRTQEPEGIEELSDYIHMDFEDESDPLFDHENETEDDDDDYMDFVDDDIHDEGLEQEIEVDQQKLQDEFDLDIYDFDSLTDEENDCPLKRSLGKIRRKKKMNRDSVNEPFFVGQCFNSREELRLLVKKLVVDSRSQLKICRNDPNRFRVMCEGSNLEFKEGTTEGSNVNSEATSGSKTAALSRKVKKMQKKKNKKGICFIG
ncbi:hypothetical protein R6Q59_003462 [Mikania micrantha]